jgi:molybdate transport system substrate-binding protein
MSAATATSPALKVFSTNAMRAVLAELVSGFEAAAGCRVDTVYSTTAQTLERIRRGETGDVVIGTVPGIEDLLRQGKIVPGTRADLGQAAIAVAVRAGTPRPDVSSPEAFRRAMLAAKSIAWTTAGQSGIHFESVVERLGIADAVKAKGVVIAGGLIGELLVQGKAEVGIQMVSEILAVPGADLVGEFPGELQQMTDFCAAILGGSAHSAAAKAFIGFLTTPAAAQLLEKKGIAKKPA